MLKECRSHGYFREEFCPHCGDEGKFLLNDEEVEILGRTMAGVLRHSRNDTASRWTRTGGSTFGTS